MPAPPLLYTVNIITDVFRDGREDWRMRITLHNGLTQEYAIDPGVEVDATEQAFSLLKATKGLQRPVDA